MLQADDPVEYVGDEDGEHDFFRGHPGRVVDLGLWPDEIAVTFVHGPTICMPPSEVAVLDEDEYARRRLRVFRRRHPLDERSITLHPLFDWPEGEEPTDP